MTLEESLCVQRSSKHPDTHYTSPSCLQDLLAGSDKYIRHGGNVYHFCRQSFLVIGVKMEDGHRDPKQTAFQCSPENSFLPQHLYEKQSYLS